ncbi:hypothetical protein GGR57DRAFT_157009 [Xylariaceae sp. FL1272]|nr:hypothetical protein GGR57DRAFT_157009 [Xylariaceae sp. FL1272]
MSRKSGVAQIPAFLRGEVPPSDSELGSKEYNRPPIAIILGGGYDDKAAEAMMEASKGIKPIPWLRPDVSKIAPPLGPEYDKAIVRREKERRP